MWYAAIMLAAANALAFVDRQVLALLVVPIEADLGIGDTTMSLLLGLSFTVLQAVAGLPLGRLADCVNRRNIVVGAVSFWSVMTGLCGLAAGYWSLFAARIGVGAAEAGLTPSAHSILADYFPRERLPAAMGLYAMGIYVGNGLALLAGGWVVSLSVHAAPVLGVLSGWRVVFGVLALTGLLFAVLLMTVSEPGRTGRTSMTRLPMHLIWAQLRAQRRVYRGVFCGFCLMILVGAGTGAWIPTFFVRRFGWSLGEVGLYYGSAVLVFGTAGAWCGGWAAAALRRRGVSGANLLAGVGGLSLLVPFAVSYPLVQQSWQALLLAAGFNFFAGFPFGGGYAAIQEVTPGRMRGQMAALFVLLTNITGQGLGPTVVAFGARYYSLPGALALTAAVVLPAAVLSLWSALRYYESAVTAVVEKSRV